MRRMEYASDKLSWRSRDSETARGGSNVSTRRRKTSERNTNIGSEGLCIFFSMFLEEVFTRLKESDVLTLARRVYAYRGKETFIVFSLSLLWMWPKIGNVLSEMPKIAWNRSHRQKRSADTVLATRGEWCTRNLLLKVWGQQLLSLNKTQ